MTHSPEPVRRGPARLDAFVDPIFRWLDRILPFKRVRPLARIPTLKLRFAIVLAVAVTVTAAAVSLGYTAGIHPIWVFTAALTLVVVLVQILARGITAPLREMIAATRAMVAGDYGHRIESESADEVGQLAKAFNTMAGGLADLERQRDDLIANVGHELRTPVAVLHGSIENLLDEVVDDERGALETMLKQTDRLGRLVGELLDLSRLEGGVVVLHPENTDLVEVAKGAIAEARLRNPPPTIELSAPDALVIQGDSRRLHSVVANLIDNAIRHGGDAGPIVVEIKAAESTATLVVSDRGPGIPHEDLHRVFDRFYRADNQRRGATDGLGLGLAIASWVADLHGGSIVASDAVPTGCVMTLSLPVSPG